MLVNKRVPFPLYKEKGLRGITATPGNGARARPFNNKGIKDREFYGWKTKRVKKQRTLSQKVK